MGYTSEYAYETGKRLARNLTLTPDAEAELERIEAEKRAALLRAARAELIGRVVR